MKWQEWLVIAMFALAGYAWGIQDAHAEQDPPSPADVATVYIMTVGIAGIGVPEKAPKVYRVSNATLCEMVNRDPGCPVFGAQLADAVFYSEDLSFAENTREGWIARGVLVHEFTHYLQYRHTGGRGKTCQEKADRENGAYAVQADYLRQHDVGLVRPERSKCE